jgi:hypothetical protein
MLQQRPQKKRVTVGGDKAYDTKDFVADLRACQVTPHVAQNDKRRGGSAIDQRTTRHPGYEVSQRQRKRVEEVFGWLKTVGLLRKTRHRGVGRVGWIFKFESETWLMSLERLRPLVSSCLGKRTKVANAPPRGSTAERKSLITNNQN